MMTVIDPPPGYRAELIAALEVVIPQIDGLDDLTRSTVSGEAVGIFNAELAVRRRRRDLIIAVIVSLDSVLVAVDALAADGYPVLPKVSVPKSIFDEARKEHAAVDAAVNIFEAMPLAAEIVAELGAPEPK